ncbi:protein ABHD15 [Chanos chanos]|uniref:Protein ABHD15 n=1 Tax=Chanos chanos TaxID=29144 RepID=A0A6J2VZX3_CHACN|nr:protein ABHD15-like [Chanos chanos]
MWDFLFCLSPFLFLLVTSMLLRWQRLCHLTEHGAQHLGWCAWNIICWVLELPQTVDLGPHREGAEVRLICKPTALASYLIKNCGTLTRPQLAGRPRGDPHLQIFLNLVWPVEEGVPEQGGISFTRDHLLLRDGGIVALDWAVGFRSERATAKQEQQVGVKVLGYHSSNPPILILVPNALGRMTPHLLSLCSVALQQGFYPVVFHRRGHSGCPLSTPRYQEFGDPSDLVQAIAYLRSRHPSSALVAVSEGSGSGLLLSYLGECGSSSYLMAAACISPVFHGQLWFETPVPQIYHWVALFYRKLQISRYATALSSVMDVEQILHCRSLRDMEELMFCAAKQSAHRSTEPETQGGEEGVKDHSKTDWAGYWERNEPLRDADEVAVPVLCLYSCDDPLLPPSSTLPMSLFQNNPYFLLAMTNSGSHCGFMQEGKGDAGALMWSHMVVLEYFKVVADFFRMEEWKVNCRRDTGVGDTQGARMRTSAALPRRRRASLVRRVRSTSGPRARLRCSHSEVDTLEEEQSIFTWNRSYTR